MSYIILKQKSGNDIKIYCDQIGSGTYSNALRHENDDEVYLVNKQPRADYSKDVFVSMQDLNLTHIPKMKYIGEVLYKYTYSEEWNKGHGYKTKFYKDVDDGDDEVQLLTSSLNRVHGEISADCFKRAKFKIEAMKEIKGMTDDLITAFMAIIDTAKSMKMDYILLDLHSDNFGIDKDGTLILRDPVVVSSHE